jgi:hypothetical protein
MQKIELMVPSIVAHLLRMILDFVRKWFSSNQRRKGRLYSQGLEAESLREGDRNAENCVWTGRDV